MRKSTAGAYSTTLQGQLAPQVWTFGLAGVVLLLLSVLMSQE